jgi:glycosyltransferase involved in cell wall biosynthesis
MMTTKPVVLYLGNALSAHGKNPTAVEKLAPLLNAFCDMKIESTARNKFQRALDFVTAIIKYRKEVSLTIIDTYSGAAFYFALLAGTTCRLFNVPFCLALHGGDLPVFFERKPRLVTRLFNQANTLIAPSNYLKSFFENAGFTHLTMIPNSLEIDKFPFKQRTTSGSKLIWLRAFHRIYNPLMAVRVLQRLVAVDSAVHLTMVGPDFDNSKDEVKQLCETLGLTNNITIKGKVASEEWVTLAQEQDIFINTSNKDNLPYTILEAMAMGLPIVSTNVGGLPFFLKHGENSLLCDANADADMAQLILQLMNHEESMQQLSIKGRKTATAYSWENIQSQWVHLINKFQHD